jgi:hypothetical protein
VGFADEREMAERALAAADVEAGGEPVFPPVARRFLQAREALGLTPSEVAAQWGEQPSMYWDLELFDSEAFDVVSVQDLVTLAAVLRVSVMNLLFGEEPSPRMPPTAYSEIARRVRAEMTARSMSVEQMSEEVGWELAEYLRDPDKLSDLPIFALRWICKAADADWATTLSNPTARLTSRRA